MDSGIGETGFTLFSLKLHCVGRSLVIAVTQLPQHEILRLKVLKNHLLKILKVEIEYVCKMGCIRNASRVVLFSW